MGGFGEFAQRVLVVGVGVQQWEIRAARGDRGEAFAQLLQFGPIASGCGPAAAGWCVGGEIFGGEGTREAGGAEEDYVIGALCPVLPVHECLRRGRRRCSRQRLAEGFVAVCSRAAIVGEDPGE